MAIDVQTQNATGRKQEISQGTFQEHRWRLRNEVSALHIYLVAGVMATTFRTGAGWSWTIAACVRLPVVARLPTGQVTLYWALGCILGPLNR